MARRLCKDKSLHGISTDSVINMVGWGKESKGTTNNVSWKYETSHKYFYFVIVFQNDTVVDTDLYENWKH
jgi:phage terminase large subunit-like protein